MSGMHYARLADSPRLQRLLAYLRQRGDLGATTREIVTGADVCAVSAAVAELKRNGYGVTCTAEGVTAGGARVFRYRLDVPDDFRGDPG